MLNNILRYLHSNNAIRKTGGDYAFLYIYWHVVSVLYSWIKQYEALLYSLFCIRLFVSFSYPGSQYLFILNYLIDRRSSYSHFSFNSHSHSQFLIQNECYPKILTLWILYVSIHYIVSALSTLYIYNIRSVWLKWQKDKFTFYTVYN